MLFIQFATIAIFVWAFVAFRQWKTRRKPLLMAFASDEVYAEHSAVNAFLKDPDLVSALADFIRGAPVFESSIDPNVYWSAGGRIRVERDICGYEVTILPKKYLVDCSPHRYGLTYEQGQMLFEAILTRVPGTIHFNSNSPTD